MSAGRFITLEGGEGVGKSTQAARLAERLRLAGHAVVVTREPGGTPLGEALRELILARKPAAVETEFLLFSAARTEHLAATIAPALRAGTWVICDRFIDSTRVYQGALAGVDPQLIREVEQLTVSHVPDLTLILDLDPVQGLERATRRGELNRFDAGRLDGHRRIREAFLAIAGREPVRCAVVDAAASVPAVAEAIWAAVVERLAP
jgi:dTMP kinase